MAHLRISAHHRTAQQARLGGQPQACDAVDALNGHPEGQKSLQKAHHQQPAPFSTLPQPIAGFSGHLPGSGLGQ